MTMDIQLEINGGDGKLSSSQGEIDFTIEDMGISVFQIYVLKKRCGIGSALVKRLEDYCLEQNIQKITVPSTPSKKALSFWLSRGYYYVFSEDIKVGNCILNNKDTEKIEETNSGIILLEKNIRGDHNG
jgi:GNAT superfamily N-acetyltransferase